MWAKGSCVNVIKTIGLQERLGYIGGQLPKIKGMN